MTIVPTRRATSDDAAAIAGLLHRFNTEFDTASPGAAVLAPRMQRLLAGDRTVALVADSTDEPIGTVGLALVTLRPNVWFEGQVALLDELYVVPELRNRGIGTELLRLLERTCRDLGVDYVEINVDEADTDAQRFYERHGYSGLDPDTGERAFYFNRTIANPTIPPGGAR